MKIIYCADLHLRADTPECRTDDFTSTMLSKFQFLLEYAKKISAQIYIAGDVGHRPQWPNWLLAEVIGRIKESEVEIFAIPGQHDLPGHELGNWQKSALGVLHSSKALQMIPVPLEQVHQVKWFDTVVGFTHQLVIENKKEWPDQKATTAKRLLRSNSCDVLISGDNHKPFTVEYKNKSLINVGSMMRTTAAQVDYVPHFVVHDLETGIIDYIAYPIEKGVVSREHLEVAENAEKRLLTFVERLKDTWEAGMSFEQNMSSYIAANRKTITGDVETEIWEALEKGIK